MRVWIDLSNSPHPLLFGPVARRLEDLGNDVVVSARDNAQTLELARERWPEVVTVGGSSPPGRRAKLAAMGRRVRELRDFALERRPDVALSHNSYGQIIAARLAGVPAVTAMDFEHQPANHIAFRLAKTILLPAALRDESMRRQGAAAHKTRFYPGLKEEVYLSDFKPDPDVLRRLRIDPGTFVVVARPAPDQALYHQFGNPLFLEAVRALASEPKVRCVVLPRHAEQRRAALELDLPRCIVPETAVDSRSLMQASDLMIGAGGTMTREAALMGVRTFTLFAGRQPAVDRWLEARGLLRRLERVEDLFPLQPRPERLQAMDAMREQGDRLVGTVTAAVLEAAA
jgi:uncharacterized protein